MKSKIAALAVCLLAPVLAANAQKTEVRLATILPKGLAQDNIITKLAEDWRKASEGAVTLRKAPGGQKDGEAGIVKKLESRNYQAALLSATGLAQIDNDLQALQGMPLLFQNWDEVDYVRGRIQSELEEKLRARGYVLLFWADAGWVNFFSVQKATSPDDFKKLKMFAWGGNAHQIEIMKSLGYKPVALETDYLHSGFASRMIESAPLPPGFASGMQIPTVAPHMLDLNWSPVVGAAIIRKDVWDAIPADVQAKLAALCQKAGEDMRQEGRRFHDDTVATLRKGPKTQVNTPTAAELAEWRKLGAEIAPKVRGSIIPAGMFDEVQQALKEYRATKAATN
ncbi:MAG TPA: TRAP transporter substrate-binding protein DctP [Verrucomicrobiota bacterium]|nr:TRAP transporter substrate-binding protein DctP [Verrucomicrobiota bacterium]